MIKFAPGAPNPRTEDARFLTGGGGFSDNINLPGQTYAVFIRAPVPHARIGTIDLSAARDLPGVLIALTGRDWIDDGLGDVNGPGLLLPFTPTRRDGQTMFKPPRPALPLDAIRYAGQPVAMIVAETAAIAQDAAERVEIDYDSLPVNIDLMAANGAEAFQIWPDCDRNEAFVYEAGDADATDAAIAGAAHVIRQCLRVSRVQASPIEPRAIVADYSPARDHLTIYGGCQRPFAFRSLIANQILKIEENHLTLVAGDLGGSFGLKGSIPLEMPLVAWAARRIGRPVRWTATRSETLLAETRSSMRNWHSTRTGAFWDFAPGERPISALTWGTSVLHRPSTTSAEWPAPTQSRQCMSK